MFLDDVLFDKETGEEPLFSGSKGDEQAWQAWLTSLDQWVAANSVVHSVIMSKLPRELHAAGEKYLKAADLWSYLTTYFTGE